jgi:asparagine synthase (glutamine-hydrolysing)
MSVQAGIWHRDGHMAQREFLARTGQATAKYGPDGETMYFDGAMGMLYRPFHTTLESSCEQQPHKFASGLVMTWDGRLDNWDELIPQLERDLTSDRTEVAIAAAAFARWGTDCFAKFVGEWGLSIWDSREQELILARDYIGIRQLFYYPTPAKIIWCNHLAPLALCGDRFSLCDQYVADRLASDPDANLTPYREIYSVPPAAFVRITRSASSIYTYWTFNSTLRTRYKTDAEYEEHYRQLFRQAVRRRMRARSPILVGVSGGFDSSSIICMADDIMAKEGAQTPSVETLSLCDSRDAEEEGDFRYLTAVEEKRGRTGFHLDLAFSEALAFEHCEFVANPNWGNRLDFKAGLSSFLRERDHRVLLSGEGGDEVNGQPLDPRVQLAELLLQLRFFEFPKQLLAWSLLIRKRPLIQLFFQTLLQFAPPSVCRRLTDRGKLEPWINRRFAKHHRMSVRQMEMAKGLWLLRPSVRDAVQTITVLSRRATCSGPSVLEMRYPYLDQNLLQFLTSIPLDQLLRPGQRRSLMRRSMVHLLPAEVFGRKSKANFDHGFITSLNTHWDEVEYIFRAPLSARLGYVDGREIREALHAMKSGKCPTHVTRLLHAICLEVWLRDAEARGVISIGHPAMLRKGS